MKIAVSTPPLFRNYKGGGGARVLKVPIKGKGFRTFHCDGEVSFMGGRFLAG